jgi:elongation factor P--(R)-beta-lysine ligase
MDRAKNLRKNQTDAEAKLWSRLRAAQLGVKFRRQHPVAGYYADFCCVEHLLIVELDGGQHGEQQDYDARRTRALECAGYQVLRFWNDEVLLRTDDVLEAIVRVLGERPPPLPSPLPRRRRGRGSQAGAPQPSSPDMAAEQASPPHRGSCALSDTAGSQANLPQRSNSLSPGPAGGEGRGEGEALASTLRLRATLYRLVRTFFADRDVLEVETPILSAAGNSEPNIASFTTHFSGHVDAGPRERWLRTSPEYPLKRLLAAGVGDCYELGRVFRNGEAGGRHNPEFTMLEWYRLGLDHRQLAQEVVALVQAALALVGRRAAVQMTGYRELFSDALGLDPFTAPLEALQQPLAASHIDPQGLTRDDWLDLLITHRLQPTFPRERITVICDYPASQCALARIRAEEPPVAERFELYLGPHELANGYHELNDAAEQRQRFERDNAVRRFRGLREVPVDERLLAVLDAMPDCAGVALGVERLLMCMAGTDAIADVLAFPFADA